MKLGYCENAEKRLFIIISDIVKRNEHSGQSSEVLQFLATPTYLYKGREMRKQCDKQNIVYPPNKSMIPYAYLQQWRQLFKREKKEIFNRKVDEVEVREKKKGSICCTQKQCSHQ